MKSNISGGFQSHGGSPKWMVYFRENSTKIRMRTGGYPMTQETPIWNHRMGMLNDVEWGCCRKVEMQDVVLDFVGEHRCPAGLGMIYPA